MGNGKSDAILRFSLLWKPNNPPPSPLITYAKNFGFEHLYHIKCLLLLFRLFCSSNDFIEQLLNPILSLSLYNYCYFRIWNCKSAFQIGCAIRPIFFFFQTIEEYSFRTFEIEVLLFWELIVFDKISQCSIVLFSI